MFKEYRIAERPVDDENKTVDVRVSMEITQLDEYVIVQKIKFGFQIWL